MCLRRGRWFRCRLRFGSDSRRRRLWRDGRFFHDLWRRGGRRRLFWCRLGLDDFNFGQLRLAVVLGAGRLRWRCLRAIYWRRRPIRRRRRWCLRRRSGCRSCSWRRRCDCRRRCRWRSCNRRSCRGDRGGLRLLSASHRCQDDECRERNRQPQSLRTYPLRFPHVWLIPALIGAANNSPLSRANHYESVNHCKAECAFWSSFERALAAVANAIALICGGAA